MSTSRTYTAGNTLTAAQATDWAQGSIGYAQVTANQTTITTVVDLTGLTVTATLVAGRRVKITAQVGFFSTIADDVVVCNIQEGATILSSFASPQRPASWGLVMTGSVVIQPSAAAHTYKLTMARDTGTGTVTMQASATRPAFILVEDIGT